MPTEFLQPEVAGRTLGQVVLAGHYTTPILQATSHRPPLYSLVDYFPVGREAHRNLGAPYEAVRRGSCSRFGLCTRTTFIRSVYEVEFRIVW